VSVSWNAAFTRHATDGHLSAPPINSSDPWHVAPTKQIHVDRSIDWFIWEWSCSWSRLQVRTISVYAIKILCSHGLCEDALKEGQRNDWLSDWRTLYTYTEQLVVLARLLYPTPAWCEFATTSDKQRIEAFVRWGRCVRLGRYGSIHHHHHHHHIRLFMPCQNTCHTREMF